MKMLCLGHYATEVWGVRALSGAMAKSLRVKTVDLTEDLA
jgi:putative NIF3 family GTP cyclohydrolase 1 type 2